MGDPTRLSELQEHGTFTGAGPHSMPTSIPSSLRGTADVTIVFHDSTTGDVYYSLSGRVTIANASTVALSGVVENYAASGWAGNVIASVSLVDGEVVGEVLLPTTPAVPSDPTVYITFRAEGVST